MKILGVIPARYASTRYPGKPLIDILGKTMIRRVYDQVKMAGCITDLVVATDDERIEEHIRNFGGNVVMTSSEHPSGTDRCFEALVKSGNEYDYVINVQGDEPFIVPEQIDELGAVCNGKTELATQMFRIESAELLFDKGVVKVVSDRNGNALYFSRQTIPYFKGEPENNWNDKHTYFRHIGMYAYRSDVLKQITGLLPSELEKAESLEQLRWLENGYKIKVVETKFDSHSIDTPEDLDRLLRMMNNPHRQ